MSVNRWLMIIVGHIIGMIAIIGVLLPFLISAKTTELVLIGFVILFSLPFLWWNLNKGWINECLKKDEKVEKTNVRKKK